MTEWLALNISTSLNGDPANLRTIQLVQVPSIYDYFVFLHVYASRSTLTMDSIWQSKCDPRQQKLDFAHKGPGFPTWHRAYVLFVEEELGRLTPSLTDPFSKRDGDNFALPYWDWTGQTGCSVCTTDLVGAFLPNGQLLDSSPFADWVTFCPQRPDFDDCHVCDPGLLTSNGRKSPMAGATLWRKVNDPKLAPGFARLPDQLDVDITLNCSDYDAWPYSMGAGRRSFRDLLEGFTDPKDGDSIILPLPSGSANEVNINQTNTTVSVASPIFSVLNVPVHMHNLVHSYFNGSWFDVATSPNDPIFFLHHTFVDKLFELWIRKNRPSPE
ncbi:tyrosinase, partial [Clonorchis sinensis]